MTEKNSLSKKHFDEIDILKGIAILTVVLEHCSSLKYIDLSNAQWCVTLVAIIKSFNMQLFFVLSGFLFASSNTTDKKKAYISKFDRLLVPMVFLSIINITLVYSMPSVINGDERRVGFVDTIINFALYGKNYWFIYTLLIIFCITIFIKKYLTKTATISVILLLVVLYETNLAHDELFRIKDVTYFSVFFLLGYLASYNYARIKSFLKKVGVPVSLLIVYVVLFVYAKDVEFVHNWCLPLLLDVAIIGFGIMMTDSEYKYPVLKYLGKYSLQFYMFNGYALVIARILFAKVLNIQHPFALFALVYIFCLIILWILVEATKRIPIISYLCGYGRKNKTIQSTKDSDINILSKLD